MSFQRACGISDVEPGSGTSVTLTDAAGKAHIVGVIRDENGGWHAISDLCTHGDVLLSEGDVEDGCVECWGHSARFNLVTGAATLPASEPATVYQLSIEGEDVLVDVDSTTKDNK